MWRQRCSRRRAWASSQSHDTITLPNHSQSHNIPTLHHYCAVGECGVSAAVDDARGAAANHQKRVNECAVFACLARLLVFFRPAVGYWRLGMYIYICI